MLIKLMTIILINVIMLINVIWYLKSAKCMALTIWNTTHGHFYKQLYANYLGKRLINYNKL